MAKVVCREVHAGDRCINLLIEAPLSVAFDMEGNPKGRRIEKRGTECSYWYLRAGVVVLTAATYLLRRIVDANPRNDIRTVEGFASFKGKPTTKGKSTRGINSHIEDVRKLRDVAWGETGTLGRIVDPNCLKSHPEDDLRSAFAVAGMDLGIPPVVLLDDTQAAEVSPPGNAIG